MKAQTGEFVDVNGRLGVVTNPNGSTVYVQFPTGYESSYPWDQVSKKQNQRNAELAFDEEQHK